MLFRSNDTATTEIYTLSLHDALPISYVPEAKIGDFVVVHVGFAISIVSEAEARETRALLEEIASFPEA